MPLLSYEEKLENKIKEKELKLATLNAYGKKSLAHDYLDSANQAVRKKAIPLLKSLMQHENERIRLLSMKTFYESSVRGDFGAVSSEDYTYYLALISNDKMAEELANFGLFELISDRYFSQLSEFYSLAVPLCEQPIQAFSKDLVDNKETHLVIGYLKKCLIKYSDNNGESRLKALASYYEMYCQLGKSNTSCLSTGYKNLLQAKYDINTSKATALSLSELWLANHKRLWDKIEAKPPLISPYFSRGLMQSLDFTRDDNYVEAITTLKSLLANEKRLSEHDIASGHKFLMSFYLRLEEKANIDNAINSAERALVGDHLSQVNKQAVIYMLQKLYLENQQYDKYISFIGQRILATQGNRQILTEVPKLQVSS
ncbi:MAG: hypothetical protein ACSHW0_16465 [Thalassotalea sp.]